MQKINVNYCPDSADGQHAGSAFYKEDAACLACGVTRREMGDPRVDPVFSRCDLCGTEWQTTETVKDCPRQGCMEIRPLVMAQPRPSNFPLSSLHSAMLAAFELGMFCARGEM